MNLSYNLEKGLNFMGCKFSISELLRSESEDFWKTTIGLSTLSIRMLANSSRWLFTKLVLNSNRFGMLKTSAQLKINLSYFA
jgi:hypothetical protein